MELAFAGCFRRPLAARRSLAGAFVSARFQAHRLLSFAWPAGVGAGGGPCRAIMIRDVDRILKGEKPADLPVRGAD
jgi:hypothetical protein